MKVQEPNHPVSELTLQQLLRLIRRVAREERRGECFLDKDGGLVFYREPDYARYLKTQTGRAPSQVAACFVDEEGFRYSYSDWAPTTAKRQQLAAARRRRSKRVSAAMVWEELRELGVRI